MRTCITLAPIRRVLASCKRFSYSANMLGNTYTTQNCSAARALEIVGERWSLLILRDALFRGITRFSDFQRSLAIAPNILAKRLDGFVVAGLLERGKSASPAEPSCYLPTKMGSDLKPVIIGLTAWGDHWLAPNGPPVEFQHDGCGGHVTLSTICSKCNVSPELKEILAIPIRLEHRRRKASRPIALSRRDC